MFSSPYFADDKQFYPMRLLFWKPLLYRWFLFKAGKIKNPKQFSFPKSLQDHEKTVFFVPEDKKIAKVIVDELPSDCFKSILFVAHGDLEIIFSKKKATVTYYTDKGLPLRRTAVRKA